ncbi:glutathione peroxidase [Flectobacillus sp. BAB-3569]|uniref:glutathione peroxidase n=1 Tax=Flectobacillus sp. BAB-3569 TaxID=1509483 RepID=UPI000BA49329|nr:glutathione peroxidase [Flectobacillus sp. BAB-3569]PAC33192.1 glutathione peroxidase [Flectobacillus sp. BAB-3569]
MKKPLFIILLTIVTVMILKLLKVGSLLGALALPFTKNSIENRPVITEFAAKKTLYDFKMKSLEGKDVNLADYKGKKVIILNTASKCGFTPQYADWEAFYQANKAKVVVLGFPANEFGGQEPGSNSEIASFCQKNYGVSFPMFEKVVVKGEGKCDLYKWLTTKELNGWNDKEPSWNFCKYLINEKGELTNFFASGVKPNSKEFQDALNK